MPLLMLPVAGTMMGRTDVKVPSLGHSLLVHRHTACDNSLGHENGRAGFQKTPVQRALCEHSWPGPQLSPGSVQNQCWKGRRVDLGLTSGRQEVWFKSLGPPVTAEPGTSWL